MQCETAARLARWPAPHPSAAAGGVGRVSPCGGPWATRLCRREADAEAAMVPHALPGEGQPPERAKSKGGHRPGTGRLGAAAYGGATRVECRHEELAVGQRCPVCGQGTLYQLPAGVEIRIDGNALLSALHYAREKLRCSACGEIFTAGLPAGVGDEKYSARARAVLAVSRYYLGVPGYRFQGYQAMLGVPVPDATQWDQIEQVGDCAYKVFAQMEKEAAQGELIFHDDTAVRILSLMQENLALALRGPGARTVNAQGTHRDAYHGVGGAGGRAHRYSVLLQPPSCGRKPPEAAGQTGGGAKKTARHVGCAGEQCGGR